MHISKIQYFPTTVMIHTSWFNSADIGYMATVSLWLFTLWFT